MEVILSTSVRNAIQEYADSLTKNGLEALDYAHAIVNHGAKEMK